MLQPENSPKHFYRHLALKLRSRFSSLVIFTVISTVNKETYRDILGTAVAQWLRCCATNRKAAGSIPDGVIGIFH